jgi:hypothetical protein
MTAKTLYVIKNKPGRGGAAGGGIAWSAFPWRPDAGKCMHPAESDKADGHGIEPVKRAILASKSPGMALRCRLARIGLPAGQSQIVFRPAVVRYGR